MLIVTSVVLLIWAILLRAPDTRMGRALRDRCVVAPARRLNRVTRGQVSLFVLMLVVVAVIGWASAGNDLCRFASFAAPDIVLWASSIELGTLVDLFAATALTAATLRVAPVMRMLRRPVRPRAARSVARRVDHPANDDSDEPGRRAAYRVRK